MYEDVEWYKGQLKKENQKYKELQESLDESRESSANLGSQFNQSKVNHACKPVKGIGTRRFQKAWTLERRFYFVPGSRTVRIVVLRPDSEREQHSCGFGR